VPDINDAGGFPEPIDGPGVLDHGQLVYDGVCLVQPAVVGYTGCIDDEGKGRGQTFSRYYYKAAPGAEGVQSPGERAQTGADLSFVLFVVEIRSFYEAVNI